MGKFGATGRQADDGAYQIVGRDGDIEFLIQHVDGFDGDLMESYSSLQRSQVGFNVDSVTIEFQDLFGGQLEVRE